MIVCNTLYTRLTFAFVAVLIFRGHNAQKLDASSTHILQL